MEIRNNFLQHGGITPKTFTEIQNIVTSKLVFSEFDTPSDSLGDKLVVDTFEMDVSSYLDGISDEEGNNSSDGYLASLSLAV